MPEDAAISQPWHHLLAPLHVFGFRGGMALPAIREVAAADLPVPYRGLLAHHGHMTTTLEQYLGEPLALHVLDRFQEGDTYYRTVLLLGERSGRPAEFGAIAIHLQRFPAPLREAIVAARRPLGALLREQHLDDRSSPQLFFAANINPALTLVLGRQPASPLYGRCNALLDATGQPLANIVEILPRHE